jgi:hypothetical protein
MEGLAPTYRFCLEWRLALERGQATPTFIKAQCNLLEWPTDLRVLILSVSQGRMGHDLKMSAHRRALMQLVMLGMRGESVLPRLREMEIEIRRQCEHEMEVFLTRLPLFMLGPVLLLLFPAFLLLLLGPLLDQMLKGLG